MAISWTNFNGTQFPTFSADDLQFTPGSWDNNAWGGGGDNGPTTAWVGPSWKLNGVPDWFTNPSNVMYLGKDNTSNTWSYDSSPLYGSAEYQAGVTDQTRPEDFQGFQIKTADKQGTRVPYKLVNGMWTPDFSAATVNGWDTNNSSNWLGAIPILGALGGALLGPMLGAGAGAAEAVGGTAAGTAAGTAGSGGLLGELMAGGLTGGAATGTGAAGGIGGGLGAGLTTGAGTLGGGITAGSGALIPGSLGSLGALGSVGGGTLGSLGTTGLGGGAAGGLGTSLEAGMSLGDWLTAAQAGGSSGLGTLKDIYDQYKNFDKLKDFADMFTQPDKQPTTPRPGGSSSGGFGGDLMSALAAWYSAKGNEKTGDKYAELWNQTQASAKPFMDKLQESYTNPNAYLQSPEYQALAGIEQNRLDRQAAAGGRLGNDVDRAVLMQQHAQEGLGKYRQGLQSSVDSTQRQLAAMAPFFISSQQLSNNSLAPYFAALGQGGKPGAGGLGQLGGLLGGGLDKLTGLFGEGGLSEQGVTDYLDKFLGGQDNYGGGSLVDMWNNGDFNTPDLDLGDYAEDIWDWFG